MKITKSHLRKLIKEELSSALKESVGPMDREGSLHWYKEKLLQWIQKTEPETEKLISTMKKIVKKASETLTPQETEELKSTVLKLNVMEDDEFDAYISKVLQNKT